MFIVLFYSFILDLFYSFIVLGLALYFNNIQCQVLHSSQ